jgi:PEP-CTERM motif
MKINKTIIMSGIIGMLASFHGVAGTVTLSMTGLSAPVFTTSTGASVALNTTLYLGAFKNTFDLNGLISTYKAGVTGNSAAEASANAAALYTSTMTALTSSANFYNFAAPMTSTTQSNPLPLGTIGFTTSTTRTINGVAGTYSGVGGGFSVSYATFTPGASTQLYAFYGTGSEIAIVTDSTWTVPTSDVAGLTIGSSALSSMLSSELLLATYVDYTGTGDLIKSVAVAQTVIPEPSSASLLALGVAGLVALRVRRKS